MTSQQWNPTFREQHISQTQTKEYDLIIIGGGITGAGIAREAALRNLSFCLVDKNDFAFGTSSRSSKLFHGGLRYLSSMHVNLVRESTTERNWLMHHLPNLVRPLGFMYCAYEKSKDKPRDIRLALTLYDLVSNVGTRFKNYRKSKYFSPEFVEEIEPQITQYDPDLGKMLMAGFYYDTNCDDARVTLELIKESLIYSEGQSIALNYAKVNEFIKDSHDRVKGVVVYDQILDRIIEIKAKAVVAAVGIWTDELLKQTAFGEEKIYPTKGVHVVVPQERLGNRNAFGVRSVDDGRFFFVLRRGKVSVIGTTDTAYYPESKDLDHPWCKKEDCDYLFSTVNRLFPHARLTYDDIIGTFAGIRPLIREKNAKHESAVSRSHEIFETKDGVVAIAGGKSTTHRLMAEELIFYLVKKGYLPKFKNSRYLQKGFSMIPFKVGITRKDFDQELKHKGLENVAWPEQLDYLYQQFGKQAVQILEEIKRDPSLGKPLLDGYSHCKAEIQFILAHENAPHVTDVLCRRTEAQWMIWHYKQNELAEKVANIMAEFYGWRDDQKQAEMDAYVSYIKKTIWF
ncbi:MAG: glycerol-3-phosphate dehydrogenase/oxidase [Desulfobacterales bacterium]|nr:glycerol-3-phosphate dehydrogenase/oxidase [Desulfobacterales bacterium]